MKGLQINKKYFILLTVLLLSFNAAKAHPFYVSICQIEYKQETNSLEIAVKIFADDLLVGLKHAGRSKLYLGEKKENPNTDEYIFDFLKSQIKFKVNNQTSNCLYVGKEVENDVVWVYLEIENIRFLDSVEVECKLLTDVLESQSNIIQINKKGNIKNLLLNKNKTTGTVVFED